MVNEDPLRHLELIQNIINRMAKNSFLLKGWTVTLVAALFALAAQNTNHNFVVLAIFPVMAFWVLDAYYLWQERLYRELFNTLRLKEENTIRLQPEWAFFMDATAYGRYIQSWPRTMLSKSLLIFYGLIIFTVVIVGILI